ncbi:MAG: toll/interleukin-1 receptor domain-containing protein [Hyphomonadaceae bacterium]
MTVFIAHAAADQPAADALQHYLERRGHFVEHETGERPGRPLQTGDSLVALWSKDSAFDHHRLAFEKRALDAWADGRLVFVKLDHHFAPVGLRDLPAVDASFEQQRELVAWAEIDKRAREAARPPAPPSVQAPGAPQAPDQVQAPRKRAAPRVEAKGGNGGAFFWIVSALFILLGIGAAAVTAAVWLVNRIGPEPGSLGDLMGGLNQFGARYGLPEWLGAPLALALIIAALVALFAVVTHRPARSAAREEAEAEVLADESAVGGAPAPAAPASPEAVFVSYARADAPVVLPVCEAVKKEGRDLWLDKDGINAGESWAGEIVRAIKGVKGVAVMCSKAAFESDHVKREVYLADRYKKRLLPVFIEEAAPPEDFEYFFAGVQWLKLHETPEAERGQVMAQALAAV